MKGNLLRYSRQKVMKHILITNDDGVQAPGILALATAMKPLGKITILAPSRNWSMCGHAKTIFKPMKIASTTLRDGTEAFSVDGAPSDCVSLALLGAVSEPIDLVVSGINPVPNLGHDLTYSGTVTAAMEAVISKVPAIAFSMNGNGYPEDSLDFQSAVKIANQITAKVLENGIPENTLLNVNIPYLPFDHIKGIEITRLGERIYQDVLVESEPLEGHPVYMIGGDPPTGKQIQGTDFNAIETGYVSITPVQLDFTAHELIQSFKNWEW
jgi:5'-nucleotidase